VLLTVFCGFVAFDKWISSLALVLPVRCLFYSSPVSPAQIYKFQDLAQSCEHALSVDQLFRWHHGQFNALMRSNCLSLYLDAIVSLPEH